LRPTFALQAPRFCEIAETLAHDDHPGLHTLASAVARLYAAALLLPHPEPTADDVEPCEPPGGGDVRDSAKAAFGEMDGY
jgi:hypothetical protein